MHRVLIVTLAFLVLTATAETQLTQLPDVSDFRPSLDLSNYQRYAWNRSQAVPTENMANHLRIINAIQAQMKELGYRIDTVNPEVRIRYRLELRERLQGTSTQTRSVWDDANSTVQIDFNRVKEAHFSIQFVEAESNFFLWQAEGTYPAGTPDRAAILIDRAVEDLFKQYPSKE
jgi:Spy/CpxP family protein refolding chaperone